VIHKERNQRRIKQKADEAGLLALSFPTGSKSQSNHGSEKQLRKIVLNGRRESNIFFNNGKKSSWEVVLETRKKLATRQPIGDQSANK